MNDDSFTEIELFESSREREHYDNLADLYAVILATEHLERAYVRDAITKEEVCSSFLSQDDIIRSFRFLGVSPISNLN